MILGIGSDIVDIRRIEKVLARQGARFIARCFAPEEQVYGPADPRAAAHYAKRFAAKEAAAKALGTGIADGVYLKDLVVVRAAAKEGAPGGRPEIALRGGVQAVAPTGIRLHLSLSDEPPYALAFVVAERVSK